MPKFEPIDLESPTAAPASRAQGLDPLSFLPLPDPEASGFTIDQVWPRAASPSDVQPAWMQAMTQRPKV